MVNYSGGRKSLTLPVAKREIHNGHDLWAELLGILLSGPNLGLCSRNADRGPVGPFVPAGKGGGKGGGQHGRRQPRGGGASHTRGRRVVLPACCD